MKRIAAVTVLMVAAIILAACSGGGSGSKSGASAVKKDPRDTLIKTAISTSNPVEIAALFSAHPDMQKTSGVAEKMVLTGLLIGNINGFDLALDRARDIKLKPHKLSSDKHYCLDGTFSYSGPGRTGGGKIEIENGQGTIYVCTKPGKDGVPYLERLVFKPDAKTLQMAKKVNRGGK
jgi:predicted small secreted protein